MIVKVVAVVSGRAESGHENYSENHDAKVIAQPFASRAPLSPASALLVEELLPKLLARVPMIVLTGWVVRAYLRARVPSGHGHGGSGALFPARDVAVHAAADVNAFVDFALWRALRYPHLPLSVRQGIFRAPAAYLRLACLCPWMYAEHVLVYPIPMGSLRPTFHVFGPAYVAEHVLEKILLPKCVNPTLPFLMAWLLERTILPVQRACVV